MKHEEMRIIAIGASAGGLEPLEKFFSTIDEGMGCSFIVVQHLSPDFRSMMDELLGRHTNLAIERISDGLELKPDTIYLNLPRVTVTVEDSKFHLQASKNPVDQYHPIDMLFSSVGEQFGSRVLGIILSGTGSDGTQGAETIKQFGGQVIVQLPESSRFESMPRAVIDARLEDGSGDAERLAELAAAWARGERLELPPLQPVEGDPVSSIIALIRRHTSLDFDRYKPTTVQRRIERRASLKGLADLSQYYKCLTESPEELDLLYSDMLIEVTSFFRDVNAFEALDRLCIESLVQKLRDGGSVRIWVAGCASGEEVYSIAMLLVERAEAENLRLDVRILASDAHGRSLANANAGRFPRESINHLSEERTSRFFDIHGEDVQVKSDVRKLVLFSTHDVIRDTPFTQVDLLSCRNLLIYLNNETQEHVIAKFHFSLVKGGILFLGPSESPVGATDEFEVLDSRWRIYRKRREFSLRDTNSFAGTVPPLETFKKALTNLPNTTAAIGTTSPVLPDARTLRNRQAHQHALEEVIKTYAPPGFLVADDGSILHVFGDAGTLLPVASGEFSRKLTDLIHTDFKATVFSALHRGRQDDFDRFERRLHVENDDVAGTYDVTLTRTGKPGREMEENYFLLTIRRIEANSIDPSLVQHPETASLASPEDSADKALLMQRIRSLEDGLSASEESLQLTIEELETSNEELQSTNEELTASNEELQSTNEELQSTNEELHSVNEELFTVSAEHQRRTNELAELNDEIDQLLAQSEIGTLHLDSELKIKRYSSAATNLFRLSAANLSRTIDAVDCYDDSISLATLARNVLKTGIPWESELVVDGRNFVLKIVANRDAHEKIIGALVTSLDTTSLRTAEDELARIGHDYRSIIEDTSSHILRWERDTTRIIFCNDRYASYFGVKSEDLVGQLLRPLIPANQREAYFKFVETIPSDEARVHHIVRSRGDGTSTVTGGITRAISNRKGEVIAYQSIGQELTDSNAYGATLEELMLIATDNESSPQDRLDSLMRFGLRELGMDNALLVADDDNAQTIRACCGAIAETTSVDDTLPPEFDLHSLFSHGPGIVEILNKREEKSEVKSILAAGKVASLIGQRLYFDADGTGSLVFLSADKRDTALTAEQRTILGLLAQWSARIASE